MYRYYLDVIKGPASWSFSYTCLKKVLLRNEANVKLRGLKYEFTEVDTEKHQEAFHPFNPLSPEGHCEFCWFLIWTKSSFLWLFLAPLQSNTGHHTLWRRQWPYFLFISLPQVSPFLLFYTLLSSAIPLCFIFPQMETFSSIKNVILKSFLFCMYASVRVCRCIRVRKCIEVSGQPACCGS